MSLMVSKFIKWKNVIFISCVYWLTHGMMVFISGRWWDDWVHYDVNASDMWNHALSQGRPSIFLFDRLSKNVGEHGYRIIVFFMFWAGALFFYGIVKNILKISEFDCVLITLLYITLPVNDARILLAVICYSAGYFFFLAAFYILVCLEEGKTKRIWWKYFIDIIIFLCSFILNSLLCLYIVPLIYIVVKNRNFKKLISYMAYFWAPILFYVVKNILFPPYSLYKGYNSLSIKGLINAIFILPKASFSFLRSMASSLFRYSVHAILILLVIYFIKNRKLLTTFIANLRDHQKTNIMQHSIVQENIVVDILVLGISFIVVCIGIFPYIAIGRTTVATTSVDGRDAMLSTLGGALFCFHALKIVIKKRYLPYIVGIVIISGIIHFNYQYWAFQREYFRQEIFQYQMNINSELDDCQNIVCLYSGDILGTTRFYTLNGNAYVAYGNQKHFIMDGFNDTIYLKEDSAELLDRLIENIAYHMMECDAKHKRVDAVIEFTADCSIKDTLKLKLYEIFDEERFNEYIANCGELAIWLDGTEGYDKVLALYQYENLE